MYSKLFSLAIIFFLTIFMVACSSDDDNGGTPTDEVNFHISGDVEGHKSGFATLVQVEESGIQQLFFSMNDGISGTQTFSLNLYLSNTGQDVEVPTQGDYSIGLPAAQDFWVVYTDLSGADGVEYGSIWGASGTLTITESNSGRVSGEFEFTAEGNIDGMGNPTGQIEVTEGVFSVQLP